MALVTATTTNIVGQKIEYRETFARFDPLGNGALREATRYWTQSDMNGRLVDLGGILLFNRIFAIALGLLFSATVWRFSMTERRRPNAGCASSLSASKRYRVPAIAPSLDGGRVVARDSRPSRWVQFITRLRIEVRQVLTSPGLTPVADQAIGFPAVTLWLGRSTSVRPLEHPHWLARSTPCAVGSRSSGYWSRFFMAGNWCGASGGRRCNEILQIRPGRGLG